MNRLILLAIVGVMLVACSKPSVREEYDAAGKLTAREYAGGNPDYAQYVAAASQQAAQEPVDAAACSGDARCVENLAAFATIRALAGQNRQAIQPPTPRVSGWERFGVTALKALVPLAGAAVSWHQSDNATETNMAQYGFLGGVVRDVTAASAIVAQSGPSYTIGGDYTGNDRVETTIGDDYTGGARTDIGGDSVGRDQHVGDTVGRDQIGRDRVDNSGNIGTDNRQGSDGPITDDGDDCSGESCNPIEPGE
ncbi:MAG: hypothetical protein KAY59_10920 [Acidobacteria bacterium]|nr:hypothetical protein [Acidobacteriota bacterium]